MKKIIIGIAIAGLAFGGFGVVSTPVHADHDAIEDHCPDHNGHPDKDEDGASDNDFVPEAGLLICVKAGNENSNPPGGATGIIETDGTTTLQEYLFNAGILNGSGDDGRSVSYWINYGPAPEEPELVSAEVCLNGIVTVLGPGTQAEVDALVAAYLAANPGSEEGDTCEAPEEPEVPVTPEEPVTPVTPEQPVTTPKLPTCPELLPKVNIPSTDPVFHSGLDADKDGIGCESDGPIVEAPRTAPKPVALPRTS